MKVERFSWELEGRLAGSHGVNRPPTQSAKGFEVGGADYDALSHTVMGNDRVPAITWLVTPRLPGRRVRGVSGLGVTQIITQIKATFEWIWVSQMGGEQGQSVR